MKPPMFPSLLVGTRPQQYLHRARMFRSAAVGLPAITSSEQNWPVYALLLHACELTLKAFCEQSVTNGLPAAPRVPNHDLKGLYQNALQYGLPGEPRIAEYIDVLTELHETSSMRYPGNAKTAIPDLSNIVDDVTDWLIAAVSPIVSAG